MHRCRILHTGLLFHCQQFPEYFPTGLLRWTRGYFALCTCQTGGGYFASLRARASSREPRASVCEPQKIPAKISKNGHNALIWHLLHAGYFIYANTRGTSYQTAPTKGNRTLTILIPFPNSLHKRSREVNRFVKNGKANFGSPIEGNPKYSGQKKPKWIFHLTSTEISGIFGRMKTPAVFLCWCTVAWQVRLWNFFLSFFISSN